MPIEDYRTAATTISEFLKLLSTTGGLRLKYRITAGEGARFLQDGRTLTFARTSYSHF